MFSVTVSFEIETKDKYWVVIQLVRMSWFERYRASW